MKIKVAYLYPTLCDPLDCSPWISHARIVDWVSLLQGTFPTQGLNSASLMAQSDNNSPAMQETWVQSLGQEDPLEKATATHSSTLAWKIPWTEEPGRLQAMGSQTQTRLSNFTHALQADSLPAEPQGKPD